MHTSSRGDGWAREKDIVLSVGLTNQTPNKWVQIAPKQRPVGTGIGNWPYLTISLMMRGQVA